MSDRLKAMAADVVDVSDFVGQANPPTSGGSSASGRHPRDEVRSRQESGY